MFVRLIALCLGLSLLGPGCSALPEEEENLIVPFGKEDNFFSNVAQEYMASAQVEIELGADWAEKGASEQAERARQVMEGKTKQIAWFLHVYLIDKSDDDEAGVYGIAAINRDAEQALVALSDDAREWKLLLRLNAPAVATADQIAALHAAVRALQNPDSAS